MRKIYVFLITIIFSVCICKCNIVKAEVTPLKSINEKTEKIPSKMDEYKQYDYVIDKYDVDIIVNEDNSLDVTETIVTFFNVPKHGIIRNIPYVNKIEREDGTSNKLRAKIDKFMVSEDSEITRENNNYVIKIGSEDETIEGEHAYKIKYKYILGRDKLKDCDELYYNIIGTQWDTVIGNVTYKITMPKDFDTSKVGISIGQKGTVGIGDKKGSELKIDGNIISGSYSYILMPNEGITIRTELPEGYFIAKSVMDNKINYLMFTIPIVGLIISFIMWLIYGKDNKVIVTEQHYPPEGYNSAEIGMLYRGRVTDEDVVSLLVYLANKGYIKIEEKDKENLFDIDTFKIIKLKPYDGNNEAEAIFMEGLFTSRPSIASIKKALKEGELEEENVEEVTASDLRNHFYKYVNRIKDHINRKEVRDDIFEGNTGKKSLMVALMMIASYLSIVIIPVIDYMGTSELSTVLFPIIFFIPFLAVALFAEVPIGFRIMWSGILSLMMGMFFIAMGIISAIFSETIFSIGFGIGIACIIGMGVCYKYMSKRTPFGNEMLGKIKGFKRFLENSSKEKLEAMVEDNPSYFYDILPYTYVLGVSNKWIKKFETICSIPPMWYYGHDPHFNMHRFGSFMNDTMRTSSSAMSSSPSSSGSGGGGSSGGGSGGGGGSSW